MVFGFLFLIQNISWSNLLQVFHSTVLLPLSVEEPSILEAPMDEDMEFDDGTTITYEVIERASQKGHPRLVDSLG